MRKIKSSCKASVFFSNVFDFRPSKRKKFKRNRISIRYDLKFLRYIILEIDTRLLDESFSFRKEYENTFSFDFIPEFSFGLQRTGIGFL
ncbi:hypothetical protein DLM75_03425 [Leptospira stimsonii]|uniref:Uncharacterized protein n=1 Tax=Leptospira stimsonii TaxID=2202203 RepID=A0A396ZFK5_9LEPT|nr:hypothetical protein DLM75_03425 [Leptospira stimsonii]